MEDLFLLMELDELVHQLKDMGVGTGLTSGGDNRIRGSSCLSFFNNLVH